jgi:hypothetical protein
LFTFQTATFFCVHSVLFKNLVQEKFQNITDTQRTAVEIKQGKKFLVD